MCPLTEKDSLAKANTYSCISEKYTSGGDNGHINSEREIEIETEKDKNTNNQMEREKS